MGELLALTTAVLWAISVVLFKRSVDFVTPFGLSLFKNSVAFVLLTITALAFRQVHAVVIPPKDLFLILMSGAIGIGVSDTLLFMALGKLGASRTALIDCLYSPFVILFSFFMLDEGLTLSAALGGGLILASVVVSSQRSFGDAITRKQLWTGCALGVVAMATVAFAIILVKPLLHAYPLTWLSAVRMAGGLAALMVSLPFHPDRNSVYKVFAPQRAWKWMLIGTFLGSYLSLVSWVAGFKYSQAGVAALLNQTTTVFIVLFASLFLKEPMNRHKLLAVALAFAGVAIILY